MSRKSFNPYECIGPLNTAKKALQLLNRPFDKKTLLKSFKGSSLPTNDIFWKAFKESGILQEVSRGNFMFFSKEPIYVGVLVKIQRKYQELSKRYRDNSVKKHATPELEEKEEAKHEISKSDLLALTQFSIDLLKEQGYLIFAPTCIGHLQVLS